MLSGVDLRHGKGCGARVLLWHDLAGGGDVKIGQGEDRKEGEQCQKGGEREDLHGRGEWSDEEEEKTRTK